MKVESGTGTHFEALAMPLFDSLYNFARWLTGDETGAEDLVQEACTKDLRGFSSLTPGLDFRAWIFILRNSVLLAIPTGTVMSRIARARKLLREFFAGERPKSFASARKVTDDELQCVAKSNRCLRG